MKKIVLLFLIIPIITFASLNVDKVLNTLAGIQSNKKISFFNANIHLALEDKIKFSDFTSADIVLFSSKKHQSKITIVSSYQKLKENKNSIGAIYLKKGRTQIVFVKERLAMNGLSLSTQFKKHLISEWQLNPKLLRNSLK